MNTLRWLLKHPIAFAWVLAGVAILLNSVGGGHEAAEEAHGKPEKHAVSKHEGDKHAAKEGDKADKHHAAKEGDKADKHHAAKEGEKADQHHAAKEEHAAQATPEAKTAAPVAVAAEPVKPEVLLADARKAYWDGALESAEAAYKELVKQQPDSLEYKGELANVYWKAGKSKEAAQLFAELAPQLAAKGRTAEALNMKVYVDMVDAELGKKIDAALKK